MARKTVARPARDKWTKDGQQTGIYYRLRADGTKRWGYATSQGVKGVEGNRDDAIAARAKYLTRKCKGLPVADTRTLFRDYAEEVREAKRSRMKAYTFQEWERALDNEVLPAFGHVKPAQVTADVVAAKIREWERRGLSHSTIRNYLKPLSAVVRLAIRRAAMPENPLALLSDDERPKPDETREQFDWTAEKLRALLDSSKQLARRPEARYNYHPILATLAYSGLRIGEALALRVRDIDLVEAVIHVRGSWSRTGELTTPKTAAGTRLVAIPSALVDILAQHIPADADPETWVFQSRGGGRPVGYWNVLHRGFSPARALAGIEGVSLHDLRHAHASLLIQRGLTAVEVAEHLGHRDARVTLKIYAHVFGREESLARRRAAIEDALAA